MSYVAPDGNTYKYYYETDRYVGTQYHDNYDYKIWSNVKIAGQIFNEYSNGSYLVGVYDEDSDSVGQLWIGRYSNIPEIQGYTGFNSGGLITHRQLNGQIYMTTAAGNSAAGNASISIKPNNSYFTYASSISEMKAYLTAPDVFQIPSFSFSGSILPGQNSSLSQGSCSLASPYTTSFSFEGKCIEKYSAPNGQVYNYKYSYYGVMTYQGFTADFDVYSNIKIGVLSTDRKAYALYNGVKTQVDIHSAPAGTYTNANQGTAPNDDRVKYYGNTGASNHIEHCYYSRSGTNGYTLAMTQQDGYPANFSTTFPTFSTESALLEYLSS